MASKIVEYHLEDTVLNLLEEGKSINKIATILNEKYLPSQYDTISEMAVRRWVDTHKQQKGAVTTTVGNLPSFAQKQAEADEDVNPYTETLRLIENCDNQIMVLTRQLDLERNNNDTNVARLNNQTRELLATYISRKQSLLADVAKYQKDMSSFANVKERLQLVYKVLRDISPEAYEQFKARLNSSLALRGL